jgi:phosphatidylglycerol:prolipoprotein diacylglycerol transferase
MLAPKIDPVALYLGPIEIRWYGLMYLLAFALAWILLSYQTRKSPFFTKDFRNDIVFYAGVGVIAGGRLGYALFYGLDYWKNHQDWFWPLRFWEPGMSFHGGLIGVLIAMAFLARRQGLSFLVLMDVVAPCVPLGLMCGRFANFINGELWGRVTDSAWGVVFQGAGYLPRHPSQLYEAFSEGLVLFAILFFAQKRGLKIGQMSGLFLLGYAIARICVEFFREPDPQYGYLAFGWLSMGQLLCMPMLIGGIWLWLRGRTKNSLKLTLQIA